MLGTKGQTILPSLIQICTSFPFKGAGDSEKLKRNHLNKKTLFIAVVNINKHYSFSFPLILLLMIIVDRTVIHNANVICFKSKKEINHAEIANWLNLFNIKQVNVKT